ncbi:adhesion biosynthesis transcriptional regulator (plasmid) [Stutzerimonas stutzeri]|uniref:PapB/FocB family fimbrial expression transcriptional regulator n=1 Tax=Stutzerimonas stutzeri TaxID=316 RepID=UPI001BAF7692|nr:PapB/FocB family fimbrial expression transcriptional regulator [Stutzerimonas stutzeri]QUE78390.1 adhesion biosynthesis transcriptional regulator [Stutzerimonas stutzeri]
MKVDGSVLIAGNVEPEHFELLLSDTKTSGEKVIAALRDHLVNGMSAKEATYKHGVTPSQFYNRLNGIQQKHAFICSVLKFYT